jgi:hypothetical protein
MDDLEPAMNTEEIFKAYQNRHKDIIRLKDGYIQIFLGGKESSKQVLQWNYHNKLNDVLLYKIVFYSGSTSERYYYTFSEEGMIQSKEFVMEKVRRDHPELFEWIIWNLP